jgi:hypothetical protein
MMQHIRFALNVMQTVFGVNQVHIVLTVTILRVAGARVVRYRFAQQRVTISEDLLFQ